MSGPDRDEGWCGKVVDDEHGVDLPGATSGPSEAEARRIVDLVTKVWYALTPEQAEQIHTTLRGANPQHIISDPWLFNALLLSEHLTERAGAEPDQRGLVETSADMSGYAAAVLRNATSSDEVVAIGSALVIGYRIQGDLDGAEQIGESVEQRLEELGRQGRGLTTRPATRPGQLSMQRGLTATLRGDFARAMTLYSTAYSQMGEPPYRHFAGANAAANAAMLSVLEGHIDLAGQWLERTAAFTDRSGWSGYLVYLGEYVARALLAVDRLDRPAAETALELAGPASVQAELWPFVAVAHCAAELAFGDPYRAHEQLRAAAFAHNHQLRDSSICGHILLRAYLDVLVAEGEYRTAMQVAEEAGETARIFVPVAHAYLRTGRHGDAARLAAQGIRRDDLSVRDIRELRLIRAVSLMKLDRADEAAHVYSIFQRADNDCTAGMRARMDPQDLADLAGTATALGQGGPGTRVGCQGRGEPPGPVNLTVTELQVLRLLADGRTIAQAAEASFTSPNTVKTHVSSIYRKLGVTNRADALWRADALGLL